MFHNDDGYGLLQDCEFMQAIAAGKITEVPTTVNARSTNCLASIKSILHVIYSLQKSNTISSSCIPTIEPDWLEVLEHVTFYMQSQPTDALQNKSYGDWIMLALINKYSCK